MKMAALIMAGGRGERFWPKSRKSLPKQFLSLTDDGKTLIQLTIERILLLVNIEDIFISTNTDYKSIVREQLPEIPENNIICEPYSRNTAPCIGLGAVYIMNKYKDAVMLILPSDHLIKNNNIFIDTIKEASELALKGNNMVTIGITPNYPETGYGYIKLKLNPNIILDRSFEVENFVEKPNLEVAKKYLASGEYLWNSGMFVWKVSSVLKEIKKFMPLMYEGLIEIKKSIGTDEEENVIKKIYYKFTTISIDYGIMEKASNIYTIPGSFGWDDVGSWLAIERVRKSNEFGNTINGKVLTIDTENCIIEGGNKLITTLGIENLIIVDTDDAILICKKDKINDIKKIGQSLKESNMDDYL